MEEVMSEASAYPNETLKLLYERSSCRSFEDRKIEPDVLRLVLEAGMHAPTGGNLQPYSIIKIEDRETSVRLAELCEKQHFIGKAPVNLLFCIDWHLLGRWAELETAPFTASSSFRHFWISFQDTVIAAQNICTAADSVGLGSVYIGSVLECLREIKEMFDLPKQVFPVVLLCLGYPKARPKIKPKHGIATIVHNGKYHEPSDQDVLAAFNDKFGSNRSKLELTDEHLNRMADVCRKVHGDEFAQRCVDVARSNNFINIAQAYFALHYCADELPQRNETFLEIMKEFGFDWFEKFDR
jgi:FMN reductase [NAD(P)H]